MDNLKYYNDSLAYDFNMFMPRGSEAVKQKPQDNIVKMPVAAKRTRARAAKRTVSLSAFAVMFSVIILAALCGNIYLRLRINEVNSQINEVKSELDVIESERTSLQVELERRISYSNIEVEATELGMRKLDKSQVKYIRVNDKNTAVNSKGETINSRQ